MKIIRAAIVGYGNIGKSVLEALQAAPDFEIAGIVRRSSSAKEIHPELSGITITDDISKLNNVDVAIVCSPSRSVPEQVKSILSLGINTVDSFDIHTGIWNYQKEIEPLAQKYDAASIIAAGWDPGSNSIVRALFEAIAPKGITYTNFGPGMSMGHTVAVKAIKGVKKALSMTIPLGTSIHRRMVYIELEDGYNFDEVAMAIKTDAYFAKDETHVMLTDNVDNLLDTGHAVNIYRKGVSGTTNNQLFEFNMKINNPALTAQIMVACARATVKAKSGAYTMIEIPVIDMLPGEREDLVRRLV
ncbi:diaminopimelate dehydrogenase [Paludibacter sp.]